MMIVAILPNRSSEDADTAATLLLPSVDTMASWRISLLSSNSHRRLLKPRSARPPGAPVDNPSPLKEARPVRTCHSLLSQNSRCRLQKSSSAHFYGAPVNHHPPSGKAHTTVHVTFRNNHPPLKEAHPVRTCRSLLSQNSRCLLPKSSSAHFYGAPVNHPQPAGKAFPPAPTPSSPWHRRASP